MPEQMSTRNAVPIPPGISFKRSFPWRGKTGRRERKEQIQRYHHSARGWPPFHFYLFTLFLCWQREGQTEQLNWPKKRAKSTQGAKKEIRCEAELKGSSLSALLLTTSATSPCITHRWAAWQALLRIRVTNVFPFFNCTLRGLPCGAPRGIGTIAIFGHHSAPVLIKSPPRCFFPVRCSCFRLPQLSFSSFSSPLSLQLTCSQPDPPTGPSLPLKHRAQQGRYSLLLFNSIRFSSLNRISSSFLPSSSSSHLPVRNVCCY